ncbi:hypothetical protein L6164_016292 [Bauhinia variegata]|uniref:Uncharacterized protein n=1 Tax=Bauhinia variegata TaxID=167791 RepID=A0ACB9NN71_BAUVA|nr:hypothetical protein L6164_016292 [Bauhinia variegata]
MLPPHHSSGLDQMLQFPAAPTPLPMDRRWKPNIELAPNCPRCASSNTKFCYYNNYSLSQPRYFCKGCRRYWTKGGSLRNVPVGGGCRKIRRGKAVRRLQSHSRSYAVNLGSEDTESLADKPDRGCCDIDMAVVFAKFLNQNLNSAHQELDNGSSSTNLYNSLTPESVESENDVVFVESQKHFDHHHPMAAITEELFPQQDQSRIQNYVRDDHLSGTEMQGLLGVGGDEVAQDMFWSNDATTSSLVNWQSPAMQVQELDYSSLPFHNDALQLPPASSMNQITDGWSWSSFDFSTSEVFSIL